MNQRSRFWWNSRSTSFAFRQIRKQNQTKSDKRSADWMSSISNEDRSASFGQACKASSPHSQHSSFDDGRVIIVPASKPKNKAFNLSTLFVKRLMNRTATEPQCSEPGDVQVSVAFSPISWTCSRTQDKGRQLWASNEDTLDIRSAAQITQRLDAISRALLCSISFSFACRWQHVRLRFLRKFKSLIWVSRSVNWF